MQLFNLRYAVLSVLLLGCTLLFGQESFKLSHLPFIQGLTEHSVSIVWTTDKPATGWVELAPDDSTHFYHSERPKYFATEYGFKKVGKVHQVTLKNLNPGTRYRYRVYSQEVLKHEGINVQYGKVVASNVYRQAPLSFKTLGATESTHFTVINDIHGRNEVMSKLLDIGNLNTSDFVVFNGDMVDNLLSEDQMYADFMDLAISKFASTKPMFFARGNHETRGPFAIAYPEYFPTPTGKLYYQYRHGETGIIVLDCGEDKPDSDIEYSGIVEMDRYRSEQAEWLAQAVKDPSFRDARYKIVICHMPPLAGWHGQQDILDKFVPILNEAGTQVMLSGHLHRHINMPASTAVKFPVLVNSNNNVLRIDLDKSKGVIKVLDQQGKVVDQIVLEPLH